jgi:outer membrane biosynthesis protein TonB
LKIIYSYKEIAIYKVYIDIIYHGHSKMSRNAITLSDLNDAVKPLIEAINKLREEQAMSTVQMSELYQMMSNFSTKMDLLDQQKNIASPVKAPVKRAVAKRGAKKTTADDEEEEDTEEKTEEKKAVKKPAPAKRGTKKAEPEPEVDAEEAEVETEAEVEVETKTKPTAKKVAAKPAVKKAPAKKASKAPAKTVRPLNKMTFFNQAFDEDEHYFDTYLTPKIKQSIADENAEEWKDAKGDALKALKKKMYYHYMKDNLNDKLQSMKEAYIEEHATNKVNLVEHEEADD